MARVVTTVGTSDRTLDGFLAVLEAHGVELVVDVRSWPASRRHPQFARASLEPALAARGLAYEWLGRELGGLRQEGYEAHMDSELFAAGLVRLIELATTRRAAVCCAERDPEHCHRRHIADVLVHRGWRVVHLIDEHETREHVVQPRQERLSF